MAAHGLEDDTKSTVYVHYAHGTGEGLPRD